jgi:transcriptional repressor NF-X1
VANVTLECACGNLQQRARCGASLHSPASERKLRCTDACALAARNASLAVALGLNPSDRAVRVEYEPWMIEYCVENKRLVAELEGIYTDL